MKCVSVFFIAISLIFAILLATPTVQAEKCKSPRNCSKQFKKSCAGAAAAFPTGSKVVCYKGECECHTNG
ncbi:unnamed protein product [Acanthoscelides obtectus]|uniref:Uncharacterized protein n=1 Tax=Acanthoscelides obtectus TaxID=200917 RepID=A0A9P0NZH0_ACAOB|nr:unnamed protein product [Acanthoscelides obtectus]CAK1679453.1 hypothetical protein AOBTE_LOCUS32257 [Acanthoscelides obtectus]